MAARFDSFGLEDLVARPEDAFRLCALAMAQGQRIRGYRGDYYRLYLGDAIVNLRTMTDPETGEEELLGMDTHAVSSCVWESKEWGLCPQEVDGERPPLGMPSKDPYICHGDPLQRWATYTQTKRISEDRTDVWTAVVSVVNADVLTWQSLGEPLRLNMAAFPGGWSTSPQRRTTPPPRGKSPPMRTWCWPRGTSTRQGLGRCPTPSWRTETIGPAGEGRSTRRWRETTSFSGGW